MKKHLLLLILILAALTGNAAGRDPLPGYKFCGTRVYSVYYAGGSPSLFYLTAYTYCRPETDDCYTYYLCGKSPYKGKRFDVKFAESDFEDLTCYSKSKTRSIREQFAMLSALNYDKMNNSYEVITNAKNGITLFLMFPYEGQPHAWQMKNGVCTHAYWLVEK